MNENISAKFEKSKGVRDSLTIFVRRLSLTSFCEVGHGS